MKTLVNKNNPSIRIIAPEIGTGTHGYYYVNSVGYRKDQWTLVEEDTLLQVRAKIKANQIIALDALKRAFVAGLLSKEEYDDGVSHINENTNDVLRDLPIINSVEEEPTEGIRGKKEEIPSNAYLEEEMVTNEFRVIRDKCFNEGIEGWQREKLIAHHFYELGLNAKKEE